MSIEGTGVSESPNNVRVLSLTVDSSLIRFHGRRGAFPDLKELWFIYTMTLLWSGFMQSGNLDCLLGNRCNWQGNPTLDCVIHQHVGGPTHRTLSMAGMYAGILFTTMGNYGYKTYLRNITMSSWKGSECPRVVYLVSEA